MTNGDLPPSLVTETGCGSSGARRFVGASSMWPRSFAKAIGANQGAAIGAKIACIQCDVGRRSGVWNAYADHQAHHDLPVQTPGCLRRAPNDAASARRP